MLPGGIETAEPIGEERRAVDLRQQRRDVPRPKRDHEARRQQQAEREHDRNDAQHGKKAAQQEGQRRLIRMVSLAPLVPGDEGGAEREPDVGKPPEPGRAGDPVEGAEVEQGDETEQSGPYSENNGHDPHLVPGARRRREQHHRGAGQIHGADDSRMQRRYLEGQELIDLARKEQAAGGDPGGECDDDGEENPLPQGQRLGCRLTNQKHQTDRRGSNGRADERPDAVEIGRPGIEIDGPYGGRDGKRRPSRPVLPLPERVQGQQRQRNKADRGQPRAPGGGKREGVDWKNQTDRDAIDQQQHQERAVAPWQG